jgi:uncharacterized protein (DUF2384 family)
MYIGEDAHETIAGLCSSKQGASVDTTERYEMDVTLPVSALERVAHGRKTRTLENHKGAAPQSPTPKD